MPKKDCRSMREVKRYATYDGEKPLQKKRLEVMAPTAAIHKTEDAAPTETTEKQNVLTTSTVFGNETMKAILKKARYSTLTKTLVATADAIATSAAAGAKAKKVVTKKILSNKVSDCDIGAAIAITHVALSVSTPQNSRHYLIATRDDKHTRQVQKAFRDLAQAAGAEATTPFVSALYKGAQLSMPTAQDARRGCVAVIASAKILSEELEKKTLPIWKMQFAAFVADNVTIAAPVSEQLANSFQLKIVSGDASILAGAESKTEDESAEATPSASSKAANANYVVCEGLHRLQLLYSMVTNSGTHKRIVVGFATPQTCSFMSNLLFALKVDVDLLNDGELLEGETAESIRAEFEEKKEGEGCVLLTCRGMYPKNADVFIQYDPICEPLKNFSKRLVALQNGTTASGEKRKRDAAASPSSAYQHMIVFLYPSEVRSIVPILTVGGKGLLNFNKLDVSNTVRYLVTLKKVGALLKKIFILNSKAYEGYRSLMLVYSHLQPKSVFDVYSLDLKEAAQQFGMEDAPLLDLRTKDTQYRPKEDYVKLAYQRMKKDRQENLKHAADLEFEGPEESDVEEAAPAQE